MKPLAEVLVRNRVSVITVAVVLIAWELLARSLTPPLLANSAKLPTFEFIFGPALIGMADYWKLPFWAPVPDAGGEQTYIGALLAIGYHSGATLSRLIAGLLIGGLIGTAAGLVLSASSIARGIMGVPLHFLRMTPLLALIPAFQFWFGVSNSAAVIFVAYGAAIPFILGTINAVTNVPRRYIESARTLGASNWGIYRRVILPAILPEMFSTIYVAQGLAWSAVIGAEYVGVQSGLGRVVIWADYFSNTGRMVIVAFLIAIFASLGVLVTYRLRRHFLRWTGT